MGRVVIDLLGVSSTGRCRSRRRCPAMCGNRSEISWPDWPCLWNSQNGPRAVERLVLELGELLPLGERLGERLAVELLEPRLVVEALELRRPARHAEVDHPPRLDREVRRVEHAPPAVRAWAPPLPRQRAGAASGPSRLASKPAAESVAGAERHRPSRRIGRPAVRSSAGMQSEGHSDGIMVSIPRDRFMQVQHDPADVRPGGQLGGSGRPSASGRGRPCRSLLGLRRMACEVGSRWLGQERAQRSPLRPARAHEPVPARNSRSIRADRRSRCLGQERSRPARGRPRRTSGR